MRKSRLSRRKVFLVLDELKKLGLLIPDPEGTAALAKQRQGARGRAIVVYGVNVDALRALPTVDEDKRCMVDTSKGAQDAHRSSPTEAVRRSDVKGHSPQGASDPMAGISQSASREQRPHWYEPTEIPFGPFKGSLLSEVSDDYKDSLVRWPGLTPGRFLDALLEERGLSWDDYVLIQDEVKYGA